MADVSASRFILTAGDAALRIRKLGLNEAQEAHASAAIKALFTLDLLDSYEIFSASNPEGPGEAASVDQTDGGTTVTAPEGTTPGTSRFLLLASGGALDIRKAGMSQAQEEQACDAIITLFKLGIVETYTFWGAY